MHRSGGGAVVAAVVVGASLVTVAGGCGQGCGGSRQQDATRPRGDAAAEGLGADGGACVTPRFRWDRTFGGGDMDHVADVAVARSGTVVATGYFHETVDFGGGPRQSAGTNDAFVASFGSDGSHLWDHTFGDELADEGVRVAVAPSGDVAVAGVFMETVDFGGGPRQSAGEGDLFVVSFTSDGRYRWDHALGGPGFDTAEAVAVDDDGNAIVTGRFSGAVDFGGGPRQSAGTTDVFVVSYGPDGSHRWDRAFGGRGDDGSRAIAVDGEGNVAVTGRIADTADLGGGERAAPGGVSGFVVSFGPQGDHRWDRLLSGTSEPSATGTALAVSADGGVVVAGILAGTADLGGGRRNVGPTNAYLASYGPDGGYRWDRTFPGVRTMVTSLSSDRGGELAVALVFGGTADFGGGERSSRDGSQLVVAYGPDGTHLWDRAVGQGDIDLNWGHAVAFDDAGGVIVAGSIRQPTDLGGGPRDSAGASDGFIVSLGCPREGADPPSE